MKLLMLIVMTSGALLCGCSTADKAEAEALRKRELRRTHPALYEHERTRELEERERQRVQDDQRRR